MVNLLKENSSGQTMYKQLQEFLNKCIELGWKPRGYKETPLGWFGKHSLYKEGLVFYKQRSYHDLFSIESRIMEFVKWREAKTQYVSGGTETESMYEEFMLLDHYMIMGPMTSEQKIKYFLENAIILTL